LDDKADVLEALGIPIELSPEDAAKALKQHGFVFFFAPKYHPAFKHVAAARKLCADRGQRTIFNFLGPLLNPGSPSCALIGVANPTLCEPLAKVLQSLGMHRGMVVCGQCRVGNEIANVDELSTIGQNTIAEFYQANGFTISESAPDLFPIQNATIEDLKGGDRERNAAIVRAVLTGEERGPKRDIVLLNAAAALFVAGHADSLIEGWEAAATTIDCGDASRKLTALRQSRN
jgi:anthranilate phosphoribosyltransferase